jgi:hypothetical protein
MTRTFRKTALLLTMLLLSAGARAQISPDSTLELVRTLYAAGSYAQAELEARRLLEHDLPGDSVKTIAEQWVAFALVAQGRTASAKDHFVNILRRQPAYDLDPVLTSPKILSVFNEARAAFRSSKPASATTPAEQFGGITYRTLLFPGWEQLYQGRTTSGAIFLGAGIATLGTGIVLEFVRADARDKYLAATSPDEIEQKYNTYNRVRTAEIWAFAAFAAVYLASEIDVFTNSPPVSVALRTTGPSLQGGGLLLTLSIRR